MSCQLAATRAPKDSLSVLVTKRANRAADQLRPSEAHRRAGPNTQQCIGRAGLFARWSCSPAGLARPKRPKCADPLPKHANTPTSHEAPPHFEGAPRHWGSWAANGRVANGRPENGIRVILRLCAVKRRDLDADMTCNNGRAS